MAEFKRYEASGAIDRQIVDLLRRYPIAVYPHVWWEFCRTVKATLAIIEAQLEEFK